MLDAETLRTLLSYSPETGLFTWLRRRNGVKSMTAGYSSNDGYVSIRINRKLYKAHRLAWLYVHGEWPNGHIDHANGITSDNRATNLRLATHSENLRNRGMNKNNRSGYKGVHWHRGNKKWRAVIGFEGKRLLLGYFDDPEEAHRAYVQMAVAVHGTFANSG